MTRGDEAVAFVTKSKGNFARDDKVPGKPIVRVDRPAAITVTEAGLKELAPLKNLAAPTPRLTEVMDAGRFVTCPAAG